MMLRSIILALVAAVGITVGSNAPAPAQTRAEIPTAQALKSAPPKARDAYLSCTQSCVDGRCMAETKQQCEPSKGKEASNCWPSYGQCVSACKATCNKTALQPMLSGKR